MQRTDVNPWEWSKGFGFSQAVQLSGQGTMLLCSGQTAINDDGSPPTTSDMGEQVAKAMDNLVAVLAGGGMDLSNVVKMTMFTTDIDELFGAYGVAIERFAGNLPASTVVGVTRLAFPELKIEIEATAVS